MISYGKLLSIATLKAVTPIDAHVCIGRREYKGIALRWSNAHRFRIAENARNRLTSERAIRENASRGLTCPPIATLMPNTLITTFPSEQQRSLLAPTIRDPLNKPSVYNSDFVSTSVPPIIWSIGCLTGLLLQKKNIMFNLFPFMWIVESWNR